MLRFDDDEGPEVDIANGLGIINAIRSSKAVKPVLALTRHDFHNRAALAIDEMGTYARLNMQSNSSLFNRHSLVCLCFWYSSLISGGWLGWVAAVAGGWIVGSIEVGQVHGHRCLHVQLHLPVYKGVGRPIPRTSEGLRRPLRFLCECSCPID